MRRGTVLLFLYWVYVCAHYLHLISIEYIEYTMTEVSLKLTDISMMSYLKKLCIYYSDYSVLIAMLGRNFGIHF